MTDEFLTMELKRLIDTMELVDTGLMLYSTIVQLDINTFKLSVKSTDYFKYVNKNYNVLKLFFEQQYIQDYLKEKTKEYIVLKLKEKLNITDKKINI